MARAFPTITMSPDFSSMRRLQIKLGLMEPKIRRKIVLNAIKPAILLFKNKAKRQAPVGRTGNLKKSHAMKALRGDPPAMVVRPKLPMGAHRFWIHEGTKQRVRKKVGGWYEGISDQSLKHRRTGRIAGYSWFANAWRIYSDVAEGLMLSKMWEIVKGVAKKGKRQRLKFHRTFKRGRRR